MYKHLATILIVTWAAISAQASGVKVVFAGFAFRGTSEDEAALFPHSSKLLTPDWNQKAVQLLKEHPPQHFEPVFDFADFEQGDTLSLACVLDSETVLIEECGEGCLLRTAIGASALFIDFKNRSVVAAFPFVNSSTAYLDHNPQPTEVAEQVRLLFDNSAGNPNVLDWFIRVVGQARPQAKVGGTLQVRHVLIDEKAVKFLPVVYARNSSALKFWLAQQFSSALGKNQGVAVLPYAPDAAMGQMALRFKTRAEVINLKIPEASYCIDLTLRGFSKIAVEENASEIAWKYGSYFSARFYQPLLNKDFLKEEATEGYKRTISKFKLSTEDWLGFERSMVEFCGVYTMKLGTAKTHRELKEILQKCKY